MSLPTRVQIIDVGPRDGLQNEKQPVPAAAKIELVARLQAAGEIDPGLTMDACRTSIFCTVTGGLIALCCSAGSGDALPDLPQNLRDNLHRSLRPQK